MRLIGTTGRPNQSKETSVKLRQAAAQVDREDEVTFRRLTAFLVAGVLASLTGPVGRHGRYVPPAGP